MGQRVLRQEDRPVSASERASGLRAPKNARRRNLDGAAAVIAALVGLLALCVSGYTAWLQRQQVRAQVWPYLILQNYDNEHSLSVVNKGVGPAVVRTARVRVDGKAQSDWDHVLDTLGVERPPHAYSLSTINSNVLSPGEHTAIISFGDERVYKSFRTAAATRMQTDLCYCSTLDECWAYSDNIFGNAPAVVPLAQCPAIPKDEAFRD